MKVGVDNQVCQAYGQCAVINEDFFTLDEEGYSSIGEGKTVPEGEAEDARIAVSSCPVAALKLL